MRWFYKLLHWMFFARAMSRGPRYFAGYEVRRQGRKALRRWTRW